MKGCGLLAKEKRKKQNNQELKKSAFQTRSIIEMFSAHRDENQFYDKDVMLDATLVAPLPKILKEQRLQKMETLFEKRTRAAHDLSKLLHLKTKQIDRHGHVLDSKSNFYCRHQMV